MPRYEFFVDGKLISLTVQAETAEKAVKIFAAPNESFESNLSAKAHRDGVPALEHELVDILVQSQPV